MPAPQLDGEDQHTPSVLTRTCRDGSFTTARVITALEATWAAIKTRHAELPQVVITVAAGSTSKRPVWGHFARMRWQQGDDQLPEILIAGEGLKRPAGEVLATLLHEAAHALADVREIKDTSRQGRWHNQKFAALANELGLYVEKDQTIGWSLTTPRDDTLTSYATALHGLEGVLTAWRHPEIAVGATRTTSNNPRSCQCACPRRIRASQTVLDAGPITCGLCGDDCTPDDTDGEASS